MTDKIEKTYPAYPRVTVVRYSPAMVKKLGQEAFRMDCRRLVWPETSWLG